TPPTTPIGSRTIIHHVALRWRDLVIDLVDRFGMPAKRLDRVGQIHRLGVSYRLSANGRLPYPELPSAPLPPGLANPEGLFALARRHPRPGAGFVGAPRRFDRAVDIGRIALRDLGQHLAGCWIQRLEGLAGFGVDKLPVDEGSSRRPTLGALAEISLDAAHLR